MKNHVTSFLCQVHEMYSWLLMATLTNAHRTTIPPYCALGSTIWYPDPQKVIQNMSPLQVQGSQT